LGGLGDQLDHAAVRGGELVGGVLAEDGEVWHPDQGHPIRLELAPDAFGYLLFGGLGSRFLGTDGRKTSLEERIKFTLVPASMPRRLKIA
jgi:hypothetical protein